MIDATGIGLAQYIEAGRALDPDEREIAALALQDAGDGDDLDPSWRPELRRRLDDIDKNGDAVLDDYEESMARLRAELAAGRR